MNKCKNCFNNCDNDNDTCGFHGDEFCSYQCQCDYWGAHTEEEQRELVEEEF